ncbi:hypothetical protein BUALT_Bualt16G0129600 [Buddleja alternifolia]|uniref:Transmembrane protein n=1 Tax=Buddleja alternifolia TaxID=168488 RepID=A0AAV6WGN6_9LAMI|nr:hypothetical protein BUALT_Bualt16G0129600 [Buddleja alternifolia]
MEASKMKILLVVVLVALSAVQNVAAQEAPAPSPASDASSFVPALFASVAAKINRQELEHIQFWKSSLSPKRQKEQSSIMARGPRRHGGIEDEDFVGDGVGCSVRRAKCGCAGCPAPSPASDASSFVPAMFASVAAVAMGMLF